MFWRLVVGVGEATLFPAAVSLLADIFEPARRGLIMGVLLMGTSMGVGVAVIVGAGLRWSAGILAGRHRRRCAAQGGGRLARVRLIAVAASLALPLLCYGAVSEARAALLTYAGFAFAVGVANVGCAAAILEIVPNALQGTAIAILAFVLILTGLASGPTFVALITEHLLKSDSSVGISIILAGALSLLPAMALLWMAARRLPGGGNRLARSVGER